MWKDDQVKALNELQSGKRYGHPYTCPNRGDGKHRHNGNDTGCLVPTTNGWICPDCNYTQDWAHEASFDLPYKEDVIGFMRPGAVVELTKVIEKRAWVETDFMGDVHVMVQHQARGFEPFEYCTFHYDYAYTDNASIRQAAERMALALGATAPVEFKSRPLSGTIKPVDTP